MMIVEDGLQQVPVIIVVINQINQRSRLCEHRSSLRYGKRFVGVTIVANARSHFRHTYETPVRLDAWKYKLSTELIHYQANLLDGSLLTCSDAQTC